MSLDFTHLHVHTEHSALDGLINARKLPQVAADLGMDACAITDHGSLTGALRFHEACLKAGIKPIIGIEAYLSIGSRFERNTEVVDADDEDGFTDADSSDGAGREKSKKYQHLTILARNETGWKNLLALHNKAEDSYWYKPRMDFDLITEHGEGLIVLTGCLAGPVAGPLSRAGRADAEARRLGRLQDPDAEQIARLTEDRDAYRAQAHQALQVLTDAVGQEHVFLEVMFHSIAAEQHAYREIRRLSEETGIPMVATNDCHYTHEGDDEAHDCLLAVGTKATLDQPGRFRFNGTPDYYVKSPEQMYAVMEQHTSNEAAIAAWKQACANTRLVVDLVEDRTIPEGKMRLPSFPVPAGETDASWFHKKVLEGARQRWGSPLPEEVKRRLRDEENIITSMGFPSYFLIVQDVIAWAQSDYTAEDWITREAGGQVPEDRQRKKPIQVGPGRGSAAGSACSYALGIVKVDPLRYGLLFERFLEPGRAGMPDIDVDFEKARRPEVLRYLQIRWGRGNVAHLGTIGTGKTKAVLKDAARILKPTQPDDELTEQVAALREAGQAKEASALMRSAMAELSRTAAEYQATGNRLANLVPGAGGGFMDLHDLVATRDDSTRAFHDLMDSSEIAAHIVETALPLAGVSKAQGIHACGFIISPDPLDELVPMRWASHAKNANPDDPRVITWEGEECESYGLLKMDVLGLMNLDVAARAMEQIAASGGPQLSLESFPDPDDLSDPVTRKTFEMISRGETSGVFQMEGSGMIQTAQEVRPDGLEDLSAVVALYRPGPLSAGMHTSYARRKRGDEPVSYTAFTDDPVEQEWIAGVFGQTYGLAIYQETIMRLGTVVAGFDAAQRSRLRKAMGKKKQSEMDAVHEMWNEGLGKEFHDEDGTLISPVFSEATGARLWDFIAGAASYLFNKSHSAAYGQLAYVTAYLKAGWPAQSGAAVLSEVGKDKEDKRLATLQSLRAQGISVLPPDVNTGASGTSVVNGAIVLGLAEIRDVGAIAQFIVAEREANGPFTSIADLARRVKNSEGQHITALALTALAESGALDCLPGTRMGQAMAARAAANGADPVPGYDWSPIEASRRQRLRIGVALGEHPVNLASDLLVELDGGPDPAEVSNTPAPNRWNRNRDEAGTTSSWCHIEQLTSGHGSYAGVVGVVQSWTEAPYSKGRRVNFTLEGVEDSISGVGWNEVVSTLNSSGITVKVGDLVKVTGKLQVREVQANTDDDEDGTDDEPQVITVREIVADTVRIIDTGEPVLLTGAPEGTGTSSFADHLGRAQAAVQAAAQTKLEAKRSKASTSRKAPVRTTSRPKPQSVTVPDEVPAEAVEEPAPKPYKTPLPSGTFRLVHHHQLGRDVPLEALVDLTPEEREAHRPAMRGLRSLPPKVTAPSVLRRGNYVLYLTDGTAAPLPEPVDGAWEPIRGGSGQWQIFVPGAAPASPHSGPSDEPGPTPDPIPVAVGASEVDDSFDPQDLADDWD